MKQVKVLIKDLNTLELLEDASKGDLINLSSLQEVDLSFVEKAINDKTNSVYKEKYEKDLLLVKEKHQKELSDLNNSLLNKNKELETLKNEEIVKLKNEYELKLKDLINSSNSKFNDEKNRLEQELKLQQEKLNSEVNKFEEVKKLAVSEESKKFELLLSNKDKEISELNLNLKQQKALQEKALEAKELSVKETYLKVLSDKDKEINTLNLNIEQQKDLHKKDLLAKELSVKETYLKEINDLKNSLTNEKALEEQTIKIKLMEQETNLKMIHDKEVEALKEKHQDDMKGLEEELDRLTRQKSALSVKMIGEDLETWCNNEMESYLQVGLDNCTWEKDNTVIKNEGETKGSKADYIFKVYATDKILPEELLASVCLDMKDEDPNSKNKQTNAHYYKALDNNRIKKNCKYAVLVSTLEADKPNSLPIFKVREYENMYVVQPPYMMTFLSMILSLSMKFKDLLLEDNKEKLELIEVTKLQEEFEKLKKTYLDDPLERLNKELSNILKASEDIKTASRKIDEACDHITTKYVSEITKKLERFNINKLSKKLAEIND